ncbi:MAG: hypothetical protein BPH100C_191 [Phage 5P_2]|nr:MAG: hypothetical protein BPH100C_191 [Phage 5P_2]
MPHIEESAEISGAPHGEKNTENPQGGYRLIARKDYPYGSGPDDFGIERGTPPVACGKFSAGGAEGNLYVLDLVNRKVKVLRGTDAALLKVVKLPGEVMGNGRGLPGYIDIAADENGIIYVVAAEAGRTRVVAFDDTGKVLLVHPIRGGSEKGAARASENSRGTGGFMSCGRRPGGRAVFLLLLQRREAHGTPLPH